MGKHNLENFPTSESALKMLGYVTEGFYDRSYVGKWIFQVMGLEFDAAQKIVEELPDQFFPETATWGLVYHEIKWGLPVRENLPYEERRRLIYQKRDFRAPMTPHRMERYLEDVTGFEVHIADANDSGEYGFVASHPNIFKAYFIGEGSLDSKQICETLDRLKQSHTTYTINDRIEVELDNRKLEHIILQNVRFKMSMPFWKGNFFDGSWVFDGSILMDGKRGYNLVLGLRHHEGGINEWMFAVDMSTNSLLRIKSTVENTVEVHEKKVGFRSQVLFWNGTFFDGTWHFDGSQLLDGERSYELVPAIQYYMGVVDVKMFGRTYMFDGSWYFDGSNHMDAMYQPTELFIKSRVLENEVEIRTAITQKSSIDFWDILQFDGKWHFDGNEMLNAVRQPLDVGMEVKTDVQTGEKIDAAVIFTRNLWYFDGSIKMDGSRILNSIYKKEDL